MSRLASGVGALLISVCVAATANGQPSPPVYVPLEQQGTVGGFPNFVPPGYPMWVPGGYPVTSGGVLTRGYYRPRPLRMSEMPGSPLMPPANALPAQRSPWTDLPRPKSDPAVRLVVTSSAAARLKALNLQAEGDHYLRQQKYHLAFDRYRQAINQADDLAGLHLRYGIVFAVLSRYERAAMEFRRATYVDPSLPTSDFTLESLFGPDSQLVRASILSRVSEWVSAEAADPERQYVLGVLLHYSQDDRAQELFSAAARLTNNAQHIAAYLPRAPEATVASPLNLRARVRNILPPALQRNNAAVEPPPSPGLIEEPIAPKANTLPPAPKPKAETIIPPRSKPVPSSAVPAKPPVPAKPSEPEGPVLLPPPSE